ATIRNVMAELEDEGYLEQPHTSAGRVPTEKGFRFYIDCLLQVEPLEEAKKRQIRRSIEEGTDTSSILQKASLILSGLSKHVGVILAPKPEVSKLKHIEFLPLRENQILVILVTEQGVVQNRLFETEELFSRADLLRMNNYLNSLLSGLSLSEVKLRLLQEMTTQQESLDRLLKQALLLSQQAVGFEADGLIIEGEKNFLYTQEFSNLGKIREILSALEEKQRLVAFLDHAIKAPGVKIFVGSESKLDQLSECSLIVSNYGPEGKPLGSLGVIGPTRMVYSKLIPMVEFTAQSLSEVIGV
ncbi:MAG TPA: heat-inducible transcription repressor HrcA, partial [Deltaproteobacteria bacterium]|nr:heat-inducible transcription repressor HrcA [Deltaproteobacteria bacterium]